MSIKAREWILPFGVFVALVCRTIIITKEPALKPAWCDEYFTFYQIDHQSFKEFCISLSTHVNAAPPQYFIFAWIIGKVFSCSILTLRLISTICCAGAFTLTWLTLRRNISSFSASLAVCVGFMGSDLFLRYSAEARFYAPYLLGISLTLYSYNILCDNNVPKLSFLLFNTFCQAIAISTAYEAGLFSFGILLALAIRDKTQHLWRPYVYLSYIIGWVPVLFCLSSICNSGNNITGWIQKPDRYYIFHPFNPGIDIGSLYYVMFILSILTLLEFFKEKQINTSKKSFQSVKTVHLLYIAISFLAVPYVFLLVSWMGKPMMVDRYYLPSLLGFVILIGYFTEKNFQDSNIIFSQNKKQAYLDSALKSLLIVLLALNPIIDAIHLKRNQKDIDKDPAFRIKLPIITDNLLTYMPLCFSQGSTSEVYFVTREDSLNSQAIKKFHSKMNFIGMNRVFELYPELILVEDSDSNPFLWIRQELLKRGYHVVETRIQNGNRNRIWTILSKVSS